MRTCRSPHGAEVVEQDSYGQVPTKKAVQDKREPIKEVWQEDVGSQPDD